MNKLIHFFNGNRSIILLLVCSALLRFYHLFDLPFTHDELSTIFRTNYTSFHELIEKGVVGDTHPAGLQVFVYYFKMLFGSEEWVIKIPFLLFGLGSVYLVYVIYSKWYNQTVGLVSATFIASLQYTVMYSQIARPYISGMFFVLGLVYCWSKLFFEKKQGWNLYISYVLFAVLCLYNHHFSALMAVIISITGLFFIDRKSSWKFILTGIGIVVLYLPHVAIFQAQLQLKGLGWLSKPTLYFVRDYFFYLCQFSWLCVGVVGLLFLVMLYRFQAKKYFSRQTFVATIWFILPFAIGYVYSLYRAPVLQYSVLIFSFPFVFPMLFGGMKLFSSKLNVILVLFILSVNCYALIVQRKHYALFYPSIYKSIVVGGEKAQQKNAVVLFAAQGTDKDMVQHYLKIWKVKYRYYWLDSFKTAQELQAFLKVQSRAHKALFVGAMFDTRPNLIPIIQEFFPTTTMCNNYISGRTFLFSTQKSKTNTMSKLVFARDQIQRLDSTKEFSLGYVARLSQLSHTNYQIIDVSVRIKSPTNLCNASIVTSIDSPHHNLVWNSTNAADFIDTNQQNKTWISIKHSVYVTEALRATKDAKLSIYVWNQKKEQFLIDKIRVSVRKDNPVAFGLYYPIP